MTDKFKPKGKQTIHLEKGKFIPFKTIRKKLLNDISQDDSLKDPFVPFTVEDAIDRQKKGDK
jgi:hypothetical protein|tara:strand:+ start:1179 stop:1364 length:186 start_codon:yes stop_codon:yes gene_type:complete